MEPSTRHQVVCFGEILWDILPSAALPGGAPMNVAYHLKKLGVHPALITRIGRDDYGKRLVDMLSGAGLATSYVQEDQEHATGLVYAKPDEYNEVHYDIVFPSAWDFIEWRDEYSHLVKEADYFIYGSLASRNKISSDTLYRLLEIARTKVLDINLRSPHFSRSGVEYLLEKADVLKMNSAELELIASWFGSYNSTEDGIKLIQDRFLIDTVIVTMGSEGALVKGNGMLHRHPGFTVRVADTIGSGDAFLAGFIYQKLQGASVEKALEFASGIGAFIATQQGACPSYELPLITKLINETSTAGR
jgi:fructokinase